MSEVKLLEAAFLGVVQGATEFLPVSSSAHLVIFQDLIGLKEPELLLDVTLHAATLLAIVLLYRRDLYEMGRQFFFALRGLSSGQPLDSIWRAHAHFRLAAYLLAGTVPAGLAGVLFRDHLERLFGSPAAASAMLVVTGTMLFLTRSRPSQGRQLEAFTLRDSLWIGAAQSVALLPGISRSGATIAAGIFCGVDRDLAARFSFLLSVPAIVGANALELGGGGLSANPGGPGIAVLLAGALTAFATGYGALKLLVRIVHRGNLSLFCYYCWALGLGGLVFFLALRPA